MTTAPPDEDYEKNDERTVLLIPQGSSSSFHLPLYDSPKETTKSTVSFSELEGSGTDSSQRMKKRSGKQLWGRLRHHVRSESFHICDLRNVEAQQLRKEEKTFDDLDLPYDFSLWDCFLALAAYLLVSVVAFSFIFERWSIIDSLYFAVVTFTTIGYGDLSPQTTGGKLFCVFFALGGVGVLAIALGVVGSQLIEAELEAVDKAETEILMDVVSRWRKETMTTRERKKEFARKRKKSSFSYLDDVNSPVHQIHEQGGLMRDQWLPAKTYCSGFCQLLRRYLPALAPLLIGASIMGYYEGWDWDDTIYYCAVTTTSIGYGDFTPQRPSMKLFAVVFIPLAVGSMGHFLATMANYIVEQRRQATDKKLWAHELSLDDLMKMAKTSPGQYERDEDGNVVVSELDFVVFMLISMKKVDLDLIDQIRRNFRVLDLTQSGTLVRKDLELAARKKLRSAKSKLDLRRYKSKLHKQGSVSQTSSLSFEEEDEGQHDDDY